MLALMAEGKPVKVIPDLTEITVREAALILGMSTDRLNRLLNENMIENRKEGDCRLVILESVMEYDREKNTGMPFSAK